LVFRRLPSIILTQGKHPHALAGDEPLQKDLSTVSESYRIAMAVARPNLGEHYFFGRPDAKLAL
jgi:hypothetical protein